MNSFFLGVGLGPRSSNLHLGHDIETKQAFLHLSFERFFKSILSIVLPRVYSSSHNGRCTSSSSSSRTTICSINGLNRVTDKSMQQNARSSQRKEQQCRHHQCWHQVHRLFRHVPVSCGLLLTLWLPEQKGRELNQLGQRHRARVILGTLVRVLLELAPARRMH